MIAIINTYNKGIYYTDLLNEEFIYRYYKNKLTHIFRNKKIIEKYFYNLDNTLSKIEYGDGSYTKYYYKDGFFDTYQHFTNKGEKVLDIHV